MLQHRRLSHNPWTPAAVPGLALLVVLSSLLYHHCCNLSSVVTCRCWRNAGSTMTCSAFLQTYCHNAVDTSARDKEQSDVSSACWLLRLESRHAQSVALDRWQHRHHAHYAAPSCGETDSCCMLVRIVPYPAMCLTNAHFCAARGCAKKCAWHCSMLKAPVHHTELRGLNKAHLTSCFCPCAL